MSSSLKVLFVQHDAELASGVGQVTLHLIDSLTEAGIACFAVLPSEGGLSNALADRGVKVLTCPSRIFPANNLTGAVSYLDGLDERAKLISDLIRKEGINIVHSNTIFVLEGALAALKANVPHIWHFHNNYLYDSKPAFTNFLRISDSSAAQFYGFLTDGIVAVSDNTASFFRDHHAPCPVHVIHNGMDLNRFDNASREIVSDIREILTIEHDAPIIGTVGRVTRQKNLLLLVASARRVLQTQPKAHFVIVGPESDAEYTKVVQAKIKEYGIQNNVHFLGSRNDLPSLYSQFTLLALSSDWEGLPTVCLEAMAAGLPIVATLCGGTDELIEHKHSGLLVEKNDLENFSGAITQLLKDPELARQMGHAGREKLQQGFSLESFGRKFIYLYREILAAHNQRDRNIRLFATESYLSLIQQHIDLTRQQKETNYRLASIEHFISQIQSTYLYRTVKSFVSHLKRFRSGHQPHS